jgi:glycosyltransferase involved in cell wall biosynthesis
MPESADTLQAERRSAEEPFFSICVPQYNRTRHLIEALKVLETQTFKSFEICISDDRSPDGLQSLLIDYLQGSGMNFAFKQTQSNLRYDGNLRSAMALATGRYCLLMGNDDCLTADSTLQYLHDELTGEANIGVLIGNFQDWVSGAVTRRVHRRAVYAEGSLSAVSHFRNMAFVSGLIVDRRKAQEFASPRWDGSEMYQMFIFCRVIASGMKLLETDASLTRKDVLVPDEEVDSYMRRERLDPCPIVERILPFVQIGQVVADSVAPFQKDESAHAERELIFQQLYRFTYPYWLFEYRRVQSWNYSAGLCLGIRPGNVVGDVEVGPWRRLRLTLLWLLASCGGLLVPVTVFDRLRGQLYKLSKSFAS